MTVDVSRVEPIAGLLPDRASPRLEDHSVKLRCCSAAPVGETEKDQPEEDQAQNGDRESVETFHGITKHPRD